MWRILNYKRLWLWRLKFFCRSASYLKLLKYHCYFFPSGESCGYIELWQCSKWDLTQVALLFLLLNSCLWERYEPSNPHKQWVKWYFYYSSTRTAFTWNNPQRLICHKTKKPKQTFPSRLSSNDSWFDYVKKKYVIRIIVTKTGTLTTKREKKMVK